MKKILFREWLKTELKLNGVSQKHLANIMGISESTVSRYLTGEITNPGTDIYTGAAKALDIPIERVLVFAGVLSTDKLSPDERDLIDGYRRLSQDRRGILLDLLNGLAGQGATIVLGNQPSISSADLPDLNSLEAITAALIRDRQRQVLDFARWQLREQLLLHISSDKLQFKSEEWRQIIEVIDLMLATGNVPPKFRELVMTLIRKIGDDPEGQLGFLLTPPSSPKEP